MGLLPNNSTKQEKDIEATIERMVDVLVLVKEVWDPDKCPADVLPWLAWALSVDSWPADWSIKQKRAIIKNLNKIHKTKGTIGAVKKALESIDYDLSVV